MLTAATRTSTAAGGRWTTGSSWVGGTAPTAADIAIVATTGGGAMTFNANPTCAGLTVNPGSTLSLLTRTLTVAGSVVNNGTMTWTTGRFTQSASGDFTNNGTLSLASGTGLMTFRGSLINNGTMTFVNRPVTFTGTNTANSTVDGFSTTGLVTYSRTGGSTTFTGDVQGAGLTITFGTLNLGTNLNHTFTGAILISGGTLNGGSSTLHANFLGTAWSRTGTFTAGTGTVDFGAAGNQSIAGSATTFNNLTLSTSGTKTLTTVPTVNGILSLEGSATSSAAPSFGTAATIQYKGITTSRTIGNEFPAAFAGTGGVIIDPGTGITITLNANKTAFKGPIQLLTGTFDLGANTIDHVLPVDGSLSVASGTTLKIGGLTLPSNYLTHSIDPLSTIEYDGIDQTVAELNSSQGYGHLILSGSGTKTLAASTIPIYGNFENNGVAIDATGNTLNFSGSSAQYIGGTSSSTFDNLTINNLAGVTLNTNQTVNGILNLTDGLLNTGTNTLTMGCSGSITNASASRYVNGILAMTFCSTGAKSFHIGSAGKYRPITVDFITLTGTSTVTAEQIETALPGTIPSDIDLFLDRYWQLSQSGSSSYSYKLTLDGTDWSPTSYLKLLKGDGSTNVHHSATTPNYTNSTAFTSFGNFGLGQLKYVTWLGASSDWFSNSNWTSDSPPTSTDEIHIPSPSTFYPSIGGTSPGNDFTLSSSGILQIENNANLTLESGPLLTFNLGAAVTTGTGSKIALQSGSRYINLSSSTPTLEAQRELTSVKGWRMLSSPVKGDIADLFAAPLVTQGFTGSSFPSLQPNLLWWLESDGGTSLQSWRKPSNASDSLVAGRGYFHYTFNGAGRLNLDGSSSGSNYTDVLPATMSVTGIEHYHGSGTYDFNLTYTTKASTQTPSPTDTIYYDLNALDQGWNLIGNPTASTLDWDAVGWTKTNVDNTIYVWDPDALSGNGDFLTWNGTVGTLNSGKIPPFQAFWTHATAATTLSFTNAVKTGNSGTFLRNAEVGSTISLPITLSVGGLQTTSFLTFSENGVIGPDSWDGYRLESMSDIKLELYSNSSPQFVSPLVINHLPNLKVKDELFDIPLYYNAQLLGKDAMSGYTLQWTLPENWPSDWEISFQDHQREKAVSMRETSSYAFTAPVSSKSPSIQVLAELPTTPILRRTEKNLLRSSSIPPFSILVSKGKSIEYMAPKPELLGNFPNPFQKISSIRFSLPQKANVKLDIYSLQGKKVASLANGTYPTGITEVPWDAKNNAPGMYFIRFQCGDSAVTKKAVLIQ